MAGPEPTGSPVEGASTSQTQEEDGPIGEMEGAVARAPGLGRFTIGRELGRGGMGEVHEAYDPARAESVALKVLMGLNASTYSRFKREFRSLSEVSHPNLVDLHELFFEHDRMFFSMELVSGGTFLHYVRPDDKLIEARLRLVLPQLVAGVDALHREGKLHRDIKPSNVMVTDEGRLVLLDFGLVQDSDAPSDDPLTAPGAVIGTPAYMSPEQASGLTTGPASDWYSVGIMLFEALTGQRPFRGSNAVRVMRDCLSRPAPRPSELGFEVAEDSDTLCAALMNRIAARRPDAAGVYEILGIEAPLLSLDARDHSRETFVGRASELAALQGAREEVGPNHSVVLLLHGPSGIGKSALLERFLGQVSETQTAQVWAGRCYERESVPFKAFDSVVDAIIEDLLKEPRPGLLEGLDADLAALSRSFPALKRLPLGLAQVSTPPGGGAASIRDRAFVALKELLRHVSSDRPTVVAIEDLQWIDDDSVALLLELVRPPDAPAVFFVGTYRHETATASPALDALLEMLGSSRFGVAYHQLTLGGLDESGASELAGRLLRASGADPGQAKAIAAECEGSPFFLAELARYAGEGGTKANVAPPLAEVLEARVGGLERSARSLLEMVGVAGQKLRQGVALRAALGERIDRRVLDRLRNAKLVRTLGVTDEDWIETYHDRIRTCVVDLLTPNERRARHLALAEAMVALEYAEPETLATHFAHAGVAERTVPHAIQAAELALGVLAFMRAAQWFELALEHLSPEDTRRAELESSLGHALAQAGHGYEASQAFLRAAEICEGDERRELRRLATHFLVYSGRFGEGRGLLRELLADVGLSYPKSRAGQIATFLGLRARIRLRGLDYEERAAADVPAELLHRIDICFGAAFLINWDPLAGVIFTARHLLLALDAGEPGRIAPALGYEALAQLIAGRSTLEQAKEDLRRAEQIADRANEAYAKSWLMSVKMSIALLSGDWAWATRTSAQGKLLLQQHTAGAGLPVLTCRYVQIWCRYQRGDWRGLEGDIRGVIAAGGASNPHREASRALLYFPLGLAEDRGEEARDAFDDFEAAASPDVPGPIDAMVFAGAVRSRLYLGEVQGAWDYAKSRRRKLERVLRFREAMSRSFYLVNRSAAAIAALKAGETSARKPALAAIEELSGLAHRPAPTHAVLARAGLEASLGDVDRAGQLLRQAVEEFEALDMQIHLAVARRHLGGLVGSDEGQRLVQQADRMMRAVGVKRPDRLADAFAPGF